jgi:hypothetical protein
VPARFASALTASLRQPLATFSKALAAESFLKKLELPSNLVLTARKQQNHMPDDAWAYRK